MTEIIFSFITAFFVYLIIGGIFFAQKTEDLRKKYKRLKKDKDKADRIAHFPINNPNPLIQISFDGELIYKNPAADRHYPDLAEFGFGHPVLYGLETFMDQARFARHDKLQKEREVIYQDTVYQQNITATMLDGRRVLIVYCHDITEIKEAQRKTRLLEAAIVNAKDAVIITDGNLDNPKILYVNEAATRISGYSAEELIGNSPKMLQGTGTNVQTLTQLRETLEQGRSFKGELLNYTKSGKSYWLDISIAPVRDEYGNVTHFAAIERDITERKAFEKEMQINREAAEVASRAKGDFLANMSHELRTPMNGIIGLSELLTEMDLGEEKKELAEAINSSSRNLLILLNDILDLSKIEAGELTLETIPFDTRRAVRQTVDLLKPIASRKGVVLESTINPIVPDRILGDPARLQQIMNNLISNAIKFTEVGYVRIDVSSSRDKAGDPEIHIRVEDTGMGIPDDKREMIFHKFTQADVSTARKYGGTGLGLAITKQLVDMMGGQISFDSAEGKGTTFYVTIPIEVAQDGEDQLAEHITKKIEKPINKKAHLMVVDDHPVNLLFMRKVLKKLGFDNVDEAQSGKEAVDLTEKKAYDLIFMDCQMPEMDGFEASTIIREREELIGDIKIIAVTADAMKGARERCLDSGMNDYISKPVDIEKLKSVLGEWIPGEAGEEEEENPYLPVEESSPVQALVMDWERLNLFTDGDREEERALIEMFIMYAKESLQVLMHNCTDGENEDWKKAAHKLKGSAANLGAQILSDSCYMAEKSSDVPSAEKSRLLEQILADYNEVVQALEKSKVS